MSTDLSTITSLKEKISENLEGSIAALLPKEIWKAMAESGVDALMKEKSQRHPLTGEEVLCSRLEILVWQEQLEQVKQTIKTELSKPEWQMQWDSSVQNMVMPAVKDAVASNAEAFVKAFIVGSMTSIVQQTLTNMQNGMFR